MYFNKEGQPSLTEVAKEQKKLPNNFPIKDFLQIYNEWNATLSSHPTDDVQSTRQGLFAKLRDLHQQYGVNTNRGVDFWNAEEEVHAFAKYLNKIQDNTTITQGRLSDAKGDILQKSADFITINGQQLNKGDIVILNESNAIFTGNYKVDVNGKITQIEININGNSGYAQLSDITFIEEANKGKAIDKSPILKYKLNVYKGFAEQELTKHGKTIKDLQEALRIKGNYSGEVNGKFDQATLEAIIAFQKTIPNAKYGADGLVGSEETIPKLFGVEPQENTKLHKTNKRSDSPVIVDKKVDSTSANSGDVVKTPSASSGRVDGASKGAQKSEINNITKESVQQAYNDFMNYVKDADKWFAGFRNSKEDVENIHKGVSEKFEKFNTAINRYIQSGGNIEDVNWMRLNVAYYYTDDLSGVSSKNQMNIVRSMNISLDILGDKAPRAPTTMEQLAAVADRIKTKNPQLADLIGKRIAEQGTNLDLSVILSNPVVKGGWEKASDEIYREYLSKLDNELDKLKGQKWNTLTETQRKALDHLRDIRGKDGIFDFTAQNREQMWQMLKYGSAIGVGIAGAALTATGIGAVGGAPLLALSGSVIAGATVTTAGTLLAQGSYGSGMDIAQETGINLISFGGGAILFKIMSGARIASFASKNIGTATLVYSTEGIGNIAIGMSTDMLRARLQNEDLDVWNSLQQNLIWAALPFALRMRGVRVPSEQLGDATQVNNLVQAATVQAALGKSPKTLLEKMKAPLSRLKMWGEKNNIPVKNDLESFRKMHISGDALYDRALQAGRNHIQIEGLPEGYKIGMSAKGDKIQIITPNGGTINLFKDELQNKLTNIFNKHNISTSSSQDSGSPKTQPESKPKASEKISQQAHNPQAAHNALENMGQSNKKLGAVFSGEWIKKIAQASGKTVGWVADQSVGPVVRMLTGNNPSNLLSLAVPGKGWGEKTIHYGKELANHWRSPIKNSTNLLFTGERKDGQGFISAIGKNVIFAGGITALDYFAVPNNEANTPANMAQNYYEMLLLGWLGIILMENGPILEGAKDMKNWLTDRIQAKPF